MFEYDSHIFDLTRMYGTEPHRVIENGEFKGHYVYAMESDVRKELKTIRPRLITCYHDEWLFVFTEAQLRKLYEAWEAEFPADAQLDDAGDIPDDRLICAQDDEYDWGIG